MGKPWFRGGVPVIRGGVPVLCDERPCPPPTCEKTYCPDTDSWHEVVAVSIAVTLPDELWVYTEPIDPATGESMYVDATKWTGLSAFSGTYTINRSRYTDSPSCSVTIPYVRLPMSYEEYHGGYDFDGCPNPATFNLQSSGTTDWLFEASFYPRFPMLAGFSFGIGGVINGIWFSPDEADPIYGYAVKHSCPTYTMTGRGGGYPNCACCPETTATATVTVSYG